ncbi:MobA [Shigella sonnei]|uniref:hypothetical protein n=1 Tax=Shigella sonnei TaxID=624 RepID=UPI0006634729|nr:hypothetical protein [Shigella sonnei]EFP9828921.1 hypothetical protein [Shigella sonnei]EFQ0597437.1 hypothetical protein [Shigella sonnei]EFZ1569703.1 hypothetical protein [Shigella sonnei]CSF18994.1 MobA [Shigella sonnei]CSG14235.1 MobA [Shigella sonnei]
MIVKFHARGKGGGSGPVDYLLGRERNREGATVLQGNPEEVRELIDAVNATMFDRYLPFSCPLNTFVTDAVRFPPFHHH